jgi:hypothetical protein
MSTRIKGAQLALTIGGTDYWADATSVVLDNEDAGAATTFEDASLGGARRYFFTVTAIQSLSSGSFWNYVWANTGEVVAYTYSPGDDANVFTGTVKIGAKPAIGGDAGVNNEFTFTTRFDCQEEPTLALD